MFPAQERFRAGKFPGAQIDLRLIEKHTSSSRSRARRKIALEHQAGSKRFV